MVLFHNISGVQRKGKMGKSSLKTLQARQVLFCCNETAVLFIEAPYEPILVYNGKSLATANCVLQIQIKHKGINLCLVTTSKHRQT